MTGPGGVGVIPDKSADPDAPIQPGASAGGAGAETPGGPRKGVTPQPTEVAGTPGNSNGTLARYATTGVTMALAGVMFALLGTV